MSNLDSDLQEETLRAFAYLEERRPDWSRHLVLCLSAEVPAQALALAIIGLGGTVLLISAEDKALRGANSAGATDFQVGTLSEAVRILKNELRKGTAVSVGLLGDPAATTGEMLQRGVQPDAVAGNADIFAAEFVDRGAERLLLSPAQEVHPTMRHTAQTPAQRKHQDAELLYASRGLPQGNRLECLNQRWLGAAPRLFPRDRHRWLFTSNTAGVE